MINELDILATIAGVVCAFLALRFLFAGKGIDTMDQSKAHSQPGAAGARAEEIKRLMENHLPQQLPNERRKFSPATALYVNFNAPVIIGAEVARDVVHRCIPEPIAAEKR